MIKYDAYKDSYIDWLGDVPKHWSNYRVDHIGTLIRGNTGFRKDELLNNGEYVALQYGKTYQVDEINYTFQYFVNSEFYKKNQVVSRGDTILISTSETIEDLGHSCVYNRDDLGLIGGEQILFKPNRKLVIGKYLYYYSKKFRNELQRYATGLKVFRFNIDDLKQVSIAIPSLGEQTAIANYLDTKTQFIDRKVNLLEKKIGNYQELRRTIINQSVTKGLDSTVKLKDSGIDWIGQVPEHWDIKRGKEIFKEISRKNRPDLPLLAASQKLGVVLKSMLENRSMEAQKSFEIFKWVKQGDFVISLRSFEGGIETAFYEGIISPAYTVFNFRPSENVTSYFTHFFKSACFIDFLQSSITGIRDGQSVKFIEIERALFPIPSALEQKQIADYLFKKIDKIDQIIANIQIQMNTLKELRKTLINDVVTGKIKVIQN